MPTVTVEYRQFSSTVLRNLGVLELGDRDGVPIAHVERVGDDAHARRSPGREEILDAAAPQELKLTAPAGP
jgi:hypothetical protein